MYMSASSSDWQKLPVPILMNLFIFVFLLLSSHLLFTVAHQFSDPHAGFEELNSSFLSHRSALATGGIAAIITLALILVFNTRNQAASMEGSGHLSLEVLRCFSFNEIVSATDNFSRVSFIGRRGFGGVYGGFIDDGKQKVAIIRLSLDNYWNEVKALSKLRHRNLVSLIGYCNESRHMILVYESMPLGTLAYNLRLSTSLSWEQRLRICIGAAIGLDYLHTGTDDGVGHGDLNSSNILLDENYMPKIANFGLTKIEEAVLPQKFDVYSFGIVLLEVMSGKTSENSRDEANQSELISWARSLMDDGRIDQIVDPRLDGQISPKCLKEFVAIFLKCLHDDPKRRPTMVQVVARLELLSDNNVCGESTARMVRDRGTQFAQPNVLEAPAIVTEPRTRETSMFCDELRQCLSMSEFVAATLNFSNNYLWYDGVYKIYKGNASLFRKRIIYKGKSICMSDDISKLTKLSNLSHPNLASMVGYCCKDNETIVGYKDEGLSLLWYDQWFYNINLSWPTRMNICIGAAEAVRCIHTTKIIHGGICPTTILLDSGSCAKLATFGSISSRWSACNDYLPPDIAGSAKMTEKSDVYLFGLLLLIVFCGKYTDFSRGYPFLLHVRVFEAIKQKTLYQITDMNLKGVEEKCLNKFLEVAFHCCSPNQVDRPSMDTVVEGLKKAQALQMRMRYR